MLQFLVANNVREKIIRRALDNLVIERKELYNSFYFSSLIIYTALVSIVIQQAGPIN